MVSIPLHVLVGLRALVYATTDDQFEDVQDATDYPSRHEALVALDAAIAQLTAL